MDTPEHYEDVIIIGPNFQGVTGESHRTSIYYHYYICFYAILNMFLPFMNHHGFIRFNVIVSEVMKEINDTSCAPHYNARFYFTCVSEEDQEEYDDVKSSSEDERNLLGRLL